MCVCVCERLFPLNFLMDMCCAEIRSCVICLQPFRMYLVSAFILRICGEMVHATNK